MCSDRFVPAPIIKGHRVMMQKLLVIICCLIGIIETAYCQIAERLGIPT